MRNGVNKLSPPLVYKDQNNLFAARKTSKLKGLNLFYSIECLTNERHLRRISQLHRFFFAARFSKHNKYSIYSVNYCINYRWEFADARLAWLIGK